MVKDKLSGREIYFMRILRLCFKVLGKETCCWRLVLEELAPTNNKTIEKLPFFILSF